MGSQSAIEREARLIILRELKAQPNRSMTSTAMQGFLLSDFMIQRPRQWVEAQFEYLEHMGAVRVIPAGSIKIATLLDHGLKHLALQVFIPDVESPTEPVL